MSARQVLLVDDNLDFRDALAKTLQGLGYDVETATNGLEALDRLRWGLRPCAILLDMRMGVMTGWDFRAEQQRSPELAAIPVIAMTAGQWKQQDLAEFSARVEKPIDVTRLAAVLQQTCH